MVADEQAEQARGRLETLRQSIGQQVEELLAKLAAALAGHAQAEQDAETRRTALGEAEKRLAVTAAHDKRTEQTLSERSDERATAVERLRHFSASGLLAAALPDLQLPEHWSIDTTLNLARSAVRSGLRRSVSVRRSKWPRHRQCQPAPVRCGLPTTASRR